MPAIRSAPGLAGAVGLRGFLPEQGLQAVMAGSLLHLKTSQGEGWLVGKRSSLLMSLSGP